MSSIQQFIFVYAMFMMFMMFIFILCNTFQFIANSTFVVKVPNIVNLCVKISNMFAIFSAYY